MNTKPISILYFNARSVVNKINCLSARAAADKPDIILICESWTHDDINEAELSLPGYSIVSRKDRTDTGKGRGGGLLMYAKQDEQVTELRIENIFCQIVGLHLIQNDIQIYLVYRPPLFNKRE